MISRTTLWRRLRDLNLVPLTSYTEISNDDLDGVLSLLITNFPQNGIVMMWGHLKSINIFVTRQRVSESLLRLRLPCAPTQLSGCVLAGCVVFVVIIV